VFSLTKVYCDDRGSKAMRIGLGLILFVGVLTEGALAEGGPHNERPMTAMAFIKMSNGVELLTRIGVEELTTL
jgi:hypothetical protein